MADDDVIEERGGYRVRLEQDQDADQPYDDGAVPILRMDGNPYHGGEVTAFNKQAEPYVEALRRLAERWGAGNHGLDTFERYLKIFHGTVKVQQYGQTPYTDYLYIGFDTSAWAEEVGAPREALSGENYLAEVVAWLEGDVYGVIVEKHRKGRTEWDDGDETYPEEWVETDHAVWGHYGREWAEQAAHEALTAYADEEKEEA